MRPIRWRFLIDRRGSEPGPGLVRVSILVALLVICGCAELAGQSPTPRLPSAEKIVERYLKVIGGKKRAAEIRDATYEWVIHLDHQIMGTARTQIKAPASRRSEMTFGNGQIISATNASSAWVMGLDRQLHTLRGSEALVAKLQGVLNASHLVDYKKRAVMARSVSFDDVAPEPLYTVEFSTRNGARLRYSFSAKTNLLVRINDEVSKTVTRLGEYRLRDGLLAPHRLSLNTSGTGELQFVLDRVSYNTGLPDSAFHPPTSTETLDVAALLRDVARNQDEIEKRVSEYAFTQRETDRHINDKGEIRKETVKVYEIFPVANRAPIQKLISENGVLLSGERVAKEEKRVQEEFLKAEREQEKDKEKAQRRRAERGRQRANSSKDGNDDDPEISQFLRACEFVSPRTEKFDNREATVFDFRPRQGFRPSNREETLIGKLVGAVWIDPLDKQVMRLEARLAESYKMAGGLLLSVRPGAALVMEQTRMAEGVWLPRFAQINLSVKVLLFGGGDYNKTFEWSDYRHFRGEVGGYKLDAPRPDENKKPK